MREWCWLRDQIRWKDDITLLACSYPQYSYDTLRALHEQLYQRQLTRNYYLLKKLGDEILRRYEQGETLVAISESMGLTPVMIARRVLELKLGVKRRKITRILRDPDLIVTGPDKEKEGEEDVDNDDNGDDDHDDGDNGNDNHENAGIERLREEIRQCVHVDEFSGPNVDRARSVLGLEYEHLLLDFVRNLRLEFETESDLRLRESFKTPDVLLRVPIAFCGRVVCWMDSKAKFADEYTLERDYTDSVSSYVGRFGPGMVIYWFGFIEDCDCAMVNDDGVLVVDHFPQQVDMLPGSQLPPLTDMHIFSP